MESRGVLGGGHAGGRRWRRATASINHPSDLRRLVKEAELEERGVEGGWSHRTRRLLSCPVLTPSPPSVNPPPPPLSCAAISGFVSHFLLNPVSPCVLVLQPSASKDATCCTGAAPSRENARKTSTFSHTAAVVRAGGGSSGAAGFLNGSEVEQPYVASVFLVAPTATRWSCFGASGPFGCWLSTFLDQRHEGATLLFGIAAAEPGKPHEWR